MKAEAIEEFPEKNIKLSPNILQDNIQKIENLKQFHYNIMEEKDPLEKQKVVWLMLHSLGYINELKIELETLCEFIYIMQAKYNKRGNPFHNFEHGVSGNFYSFLFKIKVLHI